MVLIIITPTPGIFNIRTKHDLNLHVVRVKSSLQTFYGRHHGLISRHKWSWICSTCRKHHPVFSTFMTYHLVCNQSNTTGATCEIETFSLSESMSWPQVFNVVRSVRSIVLCVVFCRSLFVRFLLAKGLSVRLWFTASDYPIDSIFISDLPNVLTIQQWVCSSYNTCLQDWV